MAANDILSALRQPSVLVGPAKELKIGQKERFGQKPMFVDGQVVFFSQNGDVQFPDGKALTPAPVSGEYLGTELNNSYVVPEIVDFGDIVIYMYSIHVNSTACFFFDKKKRKVGYVGSFECSVASKFMMHETKDGQVFGFCFSVFFPAHNLQAHGFKYPLNRVIEVRLYDKRPEKNLAAEQSWTFPVLNLFLEFALHSIESPSDKRVDLLSVLEKLLSKTLKGDAFFLKSSEGPDGWCDTLFSFNIEDRSWLVRSCSGFLATYSSVGEMFAVSNDLLVVFSKFGGKRREI
jgi:hypothetical protein